MSRLDRVSLGVPLALALSLLGGCSSVEEYALDGGLEPIQVDGSSRIGDAEPWAPEDAGGPPPPKSTLEHLLEPSSGVVQARVLLLRPEAVVLEVRAAGWNWRIYKDLVEIEVSRALGAGRVGPMTVDLIPTRCEAFDDEGQPIPDAELSHCTGRSPNNSPVEGEHMIGLLMGTSDTPTLTFRMIISPTGEVDTSALREPPEERQVDPLWEAIEARWRALGRN